MLEREEKFFKFARCLGCCFAPCGWLWVPGMAAGRAAGAPSREGLSVLEEVMGSGRVKLHQPAELYQLCNNGVVCLGLAGNQVKVLWYEFI